MKLNCFEYGTEIINGREVKKYFADLMRLVANIFDTELRPGFIHGFFKMLMGDEEVFNVVVSEMIEGLTITQAIHYHVETVGSFPYPIEIIEAIKTLQGGLH
ncbi:MAG: hypothetical protein WC856_02105 [Methylococcaceae bacterium]|jgi:hypothetical protein